MPIATIKNNGEITHVYVLFPGDDVEVDGYAEVSYNDATERIIVPVANLS